MWTKTIKHVICWIFTMNQLSNVCNLHLQNSKQTNNWLKGHFVRIKRKTTSRKTYRKLKPWKGWHQRRKTQKARRICVIGSDAPGEHLESLNGRLKMRICTHGENIPLWAPMCYVCVKKQHVGLFLSLEKETTWKNMFNKQLLYCPLWSGISKLEPTGKKPWTKTGTYRQLWKTAKRVGGIWDYDDWILCSIEIRSPQQKPVQSWLILSGIRGDWEIRFPSFLLVTFGYTVIYLKYQDTHMSEWSLEFGGLIYYIHTPEIYSTCVAWNPSPLVFFRDATGKHHVAMSMSIWFFVCCFSGRTNGI